MTDIGFLMRGYVEINGLKKLFGGVVLPLRSMVCIESLGTTRSVRD